MYTFARAMDKNQYFAFGYNLHHITDVSHYPLAHSVDASSAVPDPVNGDGGGGEAVCGGGRGRESVGSLCAIPPFTVALKPLHPVTVNSPNFWAVCWRYVF